MYLRYKLLCHNSSIESTFVLNFSAKMKIPYEVLYLYIICIATMARSVPSSYSSALLGAEKVAQDINGGSTSFISVVKNAAKTISPFLNIFSSVVKLIFSFHTTESPELRYLRQLSKTITTRFDQVDNEFSDVKRLINWSAVQISYSTLEGNIHVVSDEFRRIFQVPVSGVTAQKNMFITSYENTYAESGSKLFAGFMLDSGTLSQGLIRPAMRFTENDRGKMRTFMLGILKLLLMAAKVEMGYLGIKGYDPIVPFYSQQWRVRIERVQEKMKVIDEELKKAYYGQFLKDIDRFALDNNLFSNQNFSERLYHKLSTKYFWRDWLVVTSTHTEGRHDAHSRVCTGVIKSIHSKDIVVDSVDREKPFFNISEVNLLHSSLEGTCDNKAVYIPCAQQNSCTYPYGACSGSSYSGSSNDRCGNSYIGYHSCTRYRVRRCGSYENRQNADDIFSWFSTVKRSCSTYSSLGIIATDKRTAYFASPSGGSNSSQRLFVSDLGVCDYNVHFFG